MEIKIWDGGLQSQEVDAIQKIEKAFAEKSKGEKPGKSKSHTLQDQLRNTGLANNKNSMYPWKRYAGFRFVDSKKEGEYDLVIITHCVVLIVELKDWNYQIVTSVGDNWYKGNKYMGRSPVSVTRNKKFLLENKLKKYKHRFSNKGFIPHVHFVVVMTGNADFSQLPEDQLEHTLSLEQFLKFADKKVFNAHFRPHPNAQVLNQDFDVFDELFSVQNTQVKPLTVEGYSTIDEPIFVHPKKVYKEYLAKSESSREPEALLRVWNFNEITGNKAYTPEGRSEIVSREREVLKYIRTHSSELYNHCLRSLTSFQKDQVTSEYSEVYELPVGHLRFNEFIGKFATNFNEQDRLKLTKLLIAKFADLHEIKIAHRDIADHSLWLSPSKEIALSSFISAYHQPIGTVGDYRDKISVGSVALEEMLEKQALTPYEQDVHALGLIAWHIMLGKRMSPKSLDLVQADILKSDVWYAPVILKAIQGLYSSAIALFDELKNAEPDAEDIPTFDSKDFEPYFRDINHSRQYRDEIFLKETLDKEVYISNGMVVKAWLNAYGSNETAEHDFKLLEFLKKLDKLKASKPDYLSTIIDYGIATRSSSLYLVTDQVEGVHWIDLNVEPEEEKLALSGKLLSAVESMHSLHISHGDLHPENVIVNHEGNLFLIDIPDFLNSGDSKNHLYSPERIDSTTAFERDNFAVMRMISELLCIEWLLDSEQYPAISSAIKVEHEDIEFGFKDLGRFKKALESRFIEDGAIEIEIRDLEHELKILPDNGELFIKVEQAKKNKDELVVTFTGVGGSLMAFYDRKKSALVSVMSPRERGSVSKRDIDESSVVINVPIYISSGRSNQLTQLNEYLEGNAPFQRYLESYFEEKEAQEEEKENVAPKEVDQSLEELRKKIQITKGPKQSSVISTAALWKAILETETESLPNIEVNGEIKAEVSKHGAVTVPYSGDADPLGAFSSNDDVDALLINDDGQERHLGSISLKRSNANRIWFDKPRNSLRSLKDGDVVFFRTRQDKASFSKRKAALERILDKESVIPNLVGLFDPGCKNQAIDFEINVTEESFSRYDREDKHGNKIKLNEQQRKAFSKLMNYGPLSLLQGPPGTGKTEFISAFVHFLIESQNVQRILLVSQSHEAVNTAAERIRSHCSRLNTEIEVVRFSNREGAVSPGLKDVYSHAVTSEKRALFNAEYEYRVKALSKAFGLEEDFISSIVNAELKLFKKIDQLRLLLSTQQSGTREEDLAEIKVAATELEQLIRLKLVEDFGVSLDQSTPLESAKEIVIKKLCQDYSVQPNEVKKVRALAKVTREMIEAWSGERVNCDEFYARSRQLVTGTCVGIGQRHIGINENIYDWVIIDEAARSISSELAIAMQSGQRVLLVGDHLQLPPLYSEAHKKALSRKLGLNGSKEDMDENLQSDFARAFNSVYGQQVSASLLTQYRMAEPIGNVVSDVFYEGRLKNGERKIPDIYGQVPKELQSTVSWLDTSKEGKRSYHSSDRGTSIYNRLEADLIINVLKKIAKNEKFVSDLESLSGGEEPAIGIICMYAEQKRIIRQKFNQEIWCEDFKKLVKIDSVDSYQGKENRIIIVSLTRSDEKQSPGFLRLPNRINVALSRAMDKLMLVGNADMWRGKNKSLPLGSIVEYLSDQGEKNAYRFVTKSSEGDR